MSQLAKKGLENFSERQHKASIRDEGKIYTACGDGKIPFVSATDIAAVAMRLLIDSKLPSTNYRVLGPELLTHEEVYRRFNLNYYAIAHADSLRIDCNKNQQRFRTRGRACKTHRRAKFPEIFEVGHAGTCSENSLRD
jgi:hypothetical protein